VRQSATGFLSGQCGSADARTDTYSKAIVGTKCAERVSTGPGPVLSQLVTR
jgi:hypothetical protein